MKKIGVMLAIVLIACGSVWAQVDFPDFNAVQTKSVEKQYSAGLFDSDVDNYIDPTFFDGQIGTFMFAGGFHNGYSIPTFNVYQYPDPPAPTPLGTLPISDTISVGFAKTLGTDKYLALYYGGSFVNAWGSKEMGDKDDSSRPDYDDAERDAVWRNKLAVLFGLGNMGFRFDLIMDNTTDHTERTAGKVETQSINDAAAIALSWGANFNDKIFPWVKFGFQFPDTEVRTSLDADGKVDKKATRSEGAIFLFNAGASIDLNETSSFSADLNVGGLFPTSYKGDKDVVGSLPGYVDDDPSKDNGAYTTGGAFGIGLDADYTKVLTFGENTTVKFSPNLGLAFGSASNNDSRADDKVPSNTVFVLGAGIDIGGEYRYDKIALYTGLGLRFFEWTHYGYLGGKTKNKDTDWEFRGLAWDPDAFGNTSGNLRFGLTFTPIEGLVFGAGVTVPVFNPVLMNVGAANATGYGTFWTSGVASVTVSYKFANKPKAEEAAE